MPKKIATAIVPISANKVEVRYSDGSHEEHEGTASQVYKAITEKKDLSPDNPPEDA